MVEPAHTQVLEKQLCSVETDLFLWNYFVHRDHFCSWRSFLILINISICWKCLCLQWMFMFFQYRNILPECLYQFNELLSSIEYNLRFLLLFPFYTESYLQLLSQFQRSCILGLHELDLVYPFEPLQTRYTVWRMSIFIVFPHINQ